MAWIMYLSRAATKRPTRPSLKLAKAQQQYREMLPALAIDHLYEVINAGRRKVDVTFANAGIARLGLFGTLDESSLTSFQRRRERPLFLRPKGPSLHEYGESIILNASMADLTGFMGVYSAQSRCSLDCAHSDE